MEVKDKGLFFKLYFLLSYTEARQKVWKPLRRDAGTQREVAFLPLHLQMLITRI